MDSIKIAGTHEAAANTEEARYAAFAKDQPAPEIRSLDDWELALASGGEAIPCWP